MKYLIPLLLVLFAFTGKAQHSILVVGGQHPITKEFGFGVDYTYYSPINIIGNFQSVYGHLIGTVGYNLSGKTSKRKFSLLVGGSINYSGLFQEPPIEEGLGDVLFGAAFQYDFNRVAIKMQALAKVNWDDFETTNGEIVTIGIGYSFHEAYNHP